MFKQLLFEIVENILFITITLSHITMASRNEEKKTTLVKCWSLIFIIAFGEKKRSKEKLQDIATMDSYDINANSFLYHQS